MGPAGHLEAGVVTRQTCRSKGKRLVAGLAIAAEARSDVVDGVAEDGIILGVNATNIESGSIVAANCRVWPGPN